MSVALDRDSHVTCLQSIYLAARHLYESYGVTVAWSDELTAAAEWDGATRTVTLAADTPVEDQAWALTQTWSLCTIGRHAVPAAISMRHLHAV